MFKIKQILKLCIDSGYTPVHNAADAAYVDAIRVLHELGADINTARNGFYCALCIVLYSSIFSKFYRSLLDLFVQAPCIGLSHSVQTNRQTDKQTEKHKDRQRTN